MRALDSAEIIDWWENERFRIWRECVSAKNLISANARQSILNLSTKDLLLPTSRARQAIENRVNADLSSLGARLVRSLEESLATSINEIEKAPRFSGASPSDLALFGSGGILGLGALGTAAGATAIATATGTALVFIPTVVFSPITFAVVGISAVGMAFVSPGVLSKARERVRQRLISHIDRHIAAVLTDETPKQKNPSIWVQMSRHLDMVLKARLETH